MHKGSWWWSAGVAVLLATAGCKPQQGQQQEAAGDARAQVESAQQRSQQVLEQAREAQERAAGEQKQVADARQDVEKARQELQEAEAKAQKELQEAQTTQQQASNQAQQAQAEVQQSQQQALEAQRQQQEQMAQAQQQAAQQQEQVARTQQQTVQQQGTQQPQQLVTGRVVSASPDELLLSSAGTAGQPQLRLQLNDQTQVMVDGRQGSVADIQEGSQVRASYQDLGGEPTALRVDVTNSGLGVGGSQGGQLQQTPQPQQ